MEGWRYISCLFALGFFLNFLLFAKIACAAPGDLDPSFGNGGKVLTSLYSGDDWIDDIALQQDGKIVAAGRIEAGTISTFALARFNQDGSLDPSFGSGGSVTTQFSSDISWAESVAIQPDGKILAGGRATTAAGTDEWMVLARYLPNGTLDNTFSEDGKIETGVGRISAGYTVVVQPDGRILLAGVGNGRYIALVRYLANGSPDRSFGHLGKLTTALSTSGQEAFDIKIQPDGKILLAGYVRPSDPIASFVVVRYTPNGRLDRTFDSDGIQTTSFGTNFCIAFSLEVQPDNKILVAGYSSTALSAGAFAIVRFNANGSPDTAFNGDGKVITETGGLDGVAFDLAVQPDGKIIAAGQLRDLSSQHYSDFLMVRYNANGSLDNAFGTGGRAHTSISDTHDEIRSILIQTDGKIVAAGPAYGAGNASDFALARFLGN